MLKNTQLHVLENLVSAKHVIAFSLI